MDNALLYCNFEYDELSKEFYFINKIKAYITETLNDNMGAIVNPVYILKYPITIKKINYDYNLAFAIFIPKHKIIFVNLDENSENEFNNYVDDFIEDIGYIITKYDFETFLGRTKKWKDNYVDKIIFSNDIDIEKIFINSEINESIDARKLDIIISLATGSINDAERLGTTLPIDILDNVKRKIVLFDGEQTKFIFDEPKKKRITIQGLAGTGKTELLLHKLKELYISNKQSKIAFTCHNRILADSLKKRVPEFFNFMKVDEQIKWNERLWVMRSWGTNDNCNSGIYSYICNYYKIPFHRFSYLHSFAKNCEEALDNLNLIKDFKPCFDYILIDESQDFSNEFLKLCEKVADKNVYVAGDIFQDIFDNKSFSEIKPDFLLNRCYRTDPRTLMGAHAIGMGLFEKKLRWLDDGEWEACGYTIKRELNEFNLYRKPLRRFEDVDMDNDGIIIVQSNTEEYISSIFKIINELKSKYKNISPDDIGIVFLENHFENYKLANEISMIAKEKLGWDVNIGYETKENKNGTMFLSNKNNVKGLEFPFIICIIRNELGADFSNRNSAYMMLTRSFISSYFLIPTKYSDIENLRSGLEFVNKNNYLSTNEPSEEEKKKLKNTIIYRTNLHKSQYDLVEEIFNELNIMNKEHRKKLSDMVKVLGNEMDRNRLLEFIKSNSFFIEEQYEKY